MPIDNGMAAMVQAEIEASEERLEADLARIERDAADLELLRKVREHERIADMLEELADRHRYYENRAPIWSGHTLGNVYAARRDMIAMLLALLSPPGEGGGGNAG